jgi:KEOPS complex subunit Cgi121
MIRIICGSARINNTEEFLNQLKKISSEHNATIQAVDADLVAGTEHLLLAVKKAIQSFNKQKNTANNLAMETLLYIAGTRQIEKALQFGIKQGHCNIAIITINNNNPEKIEEELKKLINENPKVADYSPSKKERIMSAFNITQEEINAVGEDKIPKLVCERVVLTDLTK